MSDTPSFEIVLDNAISSKLSILHTALPGIIVSYDSAKQKADVQPCIKKKYQDGRVVSIPVIPNVPVVHPRAANAIIHMPLQVGDYVLLVFSERSIDLWLDKGGVVDPKDPRKHDLSDAFAIPGGYPFSNPATISNPDALEIQFPGKVRFKDNESGEELMDLLVQLMEQLIAARTFTAAGPQPLIGAGFPELKAKLLAMKG